MQELYNSGELLLTLGVLPRLRFAFLELEEHLEVYQQRRDRLIRVRAAAAKYIQCPSDVLRLVICP